MFCDGAPMVQYRPHEMFAVLPYILESNPHPFYSFRGLKNQMRIRIACGLDSRSWAGFWKNDRAAVRAVRTIQYSNLLFYLLFLFHILYSICNWISLPCRQGAVERKVQIRTANYLFFRLRNRQKLVRIRFETIRQFSTCDVWDFHNYIVEFWCFADRASHYNLSN